MTLKSDAEFKEKLTLSSKNEMRNLGNLRTYFCRKYIVFEPKKYRGVMCHNIEE